MKKLTLLLLLAIAVFTVNAQTMFQKVYSNISKFQSVQQTTDGGYIIAGSDTASASLLKLDAFGNAMWTKKFAGNTHRVFSSVQQTTDGGFIASGFVTVSSNYFKIFLARTNASGDTLWTKCLGDMTDYYGNYTAPQTAVKQTPDGGFVITGTTTNNPDYLAYLLKVDANGNIVWTKTFESYNFGAFNDVQITSDGGLIIGGIASTSAPGYVMFVVKTNSAGDTLWTRGFYDNNANACFFIVNSIIQTSDGGYMLLGNDNSEPDYEEAIMIKLDAGGDTTWTKKLYFSDPLSPYMNTPVNSIKQTSDGGYIIGGSSTYGDVLNVGGGNYAMLIKTDMNGDTLWTKKYGEYALDNYVGSDAYINNVQTTNDGGYIFAGYADIPNTGAYLVKTNSTGNTSCDNGYANFSFVHNSFLFTSSGATIGSAGTATGIYSQIGTLDTTYTTLCCSAYFTVHPDTVPHNWIVVNYASGVAPMNYLWDWGDSTTSTGPTPSHTYSTPGYYNICLTINGGDGCSSTYCDSSTYLYKNTDAVITITTTMPPSAITEVNNFENSFAIFPNPTTTSLTIETPAHSTIQILTIQGQLIKAMTVSNSKTEIDVSTMPAGVYIVEVKTEKGVGVGRFVKE